MRIFKRTWTNADGKKSTRFVLDYFDRDGVRRSKAFKKEGDARAWRIRVEAELGKGVHVPETKSPTVSSAAANWLATCEANGLEPTTINSYRAHVKLHLDPLIGQVLLSRLTVPSIREFEDKLRKTGRTPATIKRVIGSLGALIADAQERGLAAHNPVREMKVARKGKERRHEMRHRGKLEIGKDIPSPAEIKAFLGAVEPRWRPLLMTAVFCGLRSSELRGLRWSSINLTKREITVSERVDAYGKSGAPKSTSSHRTVPIPAGLAQVLREWKLICPKRDSGEKDADGRPVMILDLAFPNGAGKPESHGNVINRGLIPAMIKAGVTVKTGKKGADGMPIMAAKYTGLHGLRHFAASWFIAPVADGGVGLTLKQAQERLGHASIVMTADRYGHLLAKDDPVSEVDAAERALLG